MVTWSVFAIVTLAVGVRLGGLTAAVRSRRDGPGSTALSVTLAGTSIYSLAYGLNLLTPDIRTSELLEIPFWLGGELLVVGFVFFALAFTGRGE